MFKFIFDLIQSIERKLLISDLKKNYNLESDIVNDLTLNNLDILKAWLDVLFFDISGRIVLFDKTVLWVDSSNFKVYIFDSVLSNDKDKKEISIQDAKNLIIQDIIQHQDKIELEKQKRLEFENKVKGIN